MSKTITIKLTKVGPDAGPFNIIGNSNIIIATNVSRQTLITGVSYIVDDAITLITITSTGECAVSKTFPIGEFDVTQLAKATFTQSQTSCVWSHLTDATLYNSFYGNTEPYVIEYPFAYQYQDEILQNVIDYTKVYKYTNDNVNIFNIANKIELNDAWFNKAVLYNGQQSSGILELVNKPTNNLSVYMTYPKFNTASKSIIYTKSDNFYQYNTFWSIVTDKSQPLFIKTCESMSIDKEVNQPNMTYNNVSFRKEPLRAKDLKVRHILDDRNDINLVSQFVVAPAQISYK